MRSIAATGGPSLQEVHPPGSRSAAVHFPGLNGIRAIAAGIVLVFHIDQYFEILGLPRLGYHDTGMAQYGVILFFVLSGYLITYLLLEEKKQYVTINYKSFYLRRILRIWPLYYIIIICVAVMVSTHPQAYAGTNYAASFGFYSFFLANVGYSLGFGMLGMYQLWSVGVEEQFYFFWPFLINRAGNVARSLMVFIVVFLLVKLAVKVLHQDTLYNFLSITCFDVMAIGGLGAWMVHRQHPLLNRLRNRWIQAFAWLFLLVSVFIRPVHVFSFIDAEIHALVYLLLVINVSSNTPQLINLEQPVLNFLGRISYGIYMYHMIVIALLSFVFNKPLLGHSYGAMDYAFIYILVTALTLLLASTSYFGIEKRILSGKAKFQRIKSVN